MVRSTDSRRARNSDSVMIGGRRRPVSRPSRRRCFLASSRVEPFTDRTSSPPFGSRTWTTVSGGSSEVSESEPASAEPRRRLRLRLRPLAPASSAPSAEPLESAGALASADPSGALSLAALSSAALSSAAVSSAAASLAPVSLAAVSLAALVLRLRLRDGRLASG
jgi:hypothetical protein